ncbi:MAG: hypothetical protein NW223_11670 [Hyphomicrobiaceae bacterium]|nr:hypothetical protein [Hyphomicrobiaceae bacterium]
MQNLFRPTPSQTAVLAGAGLCALGFAMAMRYLAIENTPLGLACAAAPSGLVCGLRAGVIALSQGAVLGYGGLVAALLNLLRPSMTLALVGLGLAGAGLVLYNTSPSAVAVACLAFSLARPVPEPE